MHADVEKARPGIEALFDYKVKLHDDIMERFPAGKLPDANLVTQRFTQEQVDELLKGPLNGGKHLYTVAWPPTQVCVLGGRPGSFPWHRP